MRFEFMYMRITTIRRKTRTPNAYNIRSMAEAESKHTNVSLCGQKGVTNAYAAHIYSTLHTAAAYRLHRSNAAANYIGTNDGNEHLPLLPMHSVFLNTKFH